MKITQLAAKPQLVKLVLDNEDIVKEYGEAIEFWTWDRQPLDVFMRLANSQGAKQGDTIDVVRTMILDENGKQVIQGEQMIPSKVLIEAVAKIVEILGK